MSGISFVPATNAAIVTADIGDGQITNAKVASNAAVTWGKFDQTKFGAFSATPASRTSAYTQTYSTAARTVPNDTAVAVATDAATATVPYGYTQSQADAIVTGVNALLADLDATKKVLNSVIDDLQTYGLFQ